MDLPTIVLILICGFGAWAAARFQISGFVRWQDGFHDENGKLSFGRTAVLVSLIVSSWVICDLTLDAVKNKEDLDALFKWYCVYLGVWSGASVVVKFLEIVGVKWNGSK